MVIDPFISLFIRTGFGLLFVLTAFHKLRNLSAFRQVVIGYNVIPLKAAKLVSIVLPLAELLSAILLLWKPLFGFPALGGLLGIYALIMSFNIMRGHTQIDCGCSWGGAQSAFPSLTWAQVIRNVGLILILTLVLVPPSGRHLVFMDAVNLVLAIGFSYAAIKAAFTLIAVRGRMQEVGHV